MERYNETHRVVYMQMQEGETLLSDEYKLIENRGHILVFCLFPAFPMPIHSSGPEVR